MAGLLTPNPNFSWGAFGGDALAGLGQGLLAYGAGGQLRQQAPLIGIQGMQQAQQARAEQQQRALQTQSLTQQLAMQQMQMQRAQQADQQAAQQKQQYLGLLGGQPIQGPTPSGAPLDIKSPVNPALANLPPALQQMLPAMDPSQGMGMIAQSMNKKPDMPNLQTIRQGGNDVTGYFDPSNPKNFIQVGSGAHFAPQQPAQAPASIQEYNLAKTQGFKGSLLDYQMAQKGQGVSMTMPDGTVVQVGGNQKPLTEDQAKAAQLYARSNKQLPIVMDNFDALSNLKDQAVSGLPGSGFTTSANYQRASNALNDIAASYLYSVSGATANPGEVANLVKTVTPIVGESDASKADKKARIQDMVNSIKLRTQAGSNPAIPGAPAAPDPLGIR